MRVRPYHLTKNTNRKAVSIHALMRVRLGPGVPDAFRLGVSIHALMRVRPGGNALQFRFYSFNPRTHESATLNLAKHHPADYVSIHALMRVRPPSSWPSCRKTSFNPRTHESATWKPTRPWPTVTGFNPRTHESATISGRAARLAAEVSIHALMRVRHESRNIAVIMGSFNPRTHESATPPHGAHLGNHRVSIHALMRVRLRGGYGTDYQQCNGRFAPTSHGRYKDSRS